VRYASELAPTASGYTLLLARILLGSPDARQRDEAASLVERVCRQDARNPEAYVMRAMVFDQRGRSEDAKTALRRSLAVSRPATRRARRPRALDAGESLLKVRANAGSQQQQSQGGFFGKLFKR